MVSFNSTNLGDQIRNARGRLGLSQVALAEKIGISGSYLSNIESGNARPSTKIWPKIKEALNSSDVEPEGDSLEDLIQKIVDMGYSVTVSRHA
jgi:ribosome-binding protein aMBF1 (putative translation factor)